MCLICDEGKKDHNALGCVSYGSASTMAKTCLSLLDKTPLSGRMASLVACSGRVHIVKASSRCCSSFVLPSFPLPSSLFLSLHTFTLHRIHTTAQTPPPLLPPHRCFCHSLFFFTSVHSLLANSFARYIFNASPLSYSPLYISLTPRRAVFLFSPLPLFPSTSPFTASA